MAAPKLSAAKPAVAKKLTRVEFDRYLAVREKRQQLDRESRALDREEKAIAERIMTFATQEGGKTRTVECCGHRASITSAPGYVSWAKEYERLAGFDAAETLRTNAPPVDRLKVEKL